MPHRFGMNPQQFKQRYPHISKMSGLKRSRLMSAMAGSVGLPQNPAPGSPTTNPSPTTSSLGLPQTQEVPSSLSVPWNPLPAEGMPNLDKTPLQEQASLTAQGVSLPDTMVEPEGERTAMV